MSLRDKLKGIERQSYDLSVTTSSHVRDNYMNVVARLERTISTLTDQVTADAERLAGWRTGVTQLATNSELRSKDAEIEKLKEELFWQENK